MNCSYPVVFVFPRFCSPEYQTRNSSARACQLLGSPKKTKNGDFESYENGFYKKFFILEASHSCLILVKNENYYINREQVPQLAY